MFAINHGRLIRKAIAKFEKLAEQLERGAALQRQKRQFNDEQIKDLCAENCCLVSSATHAESVAAKLRNLIS